MSGHAFTPGPWRVQGKLPEDDVSFYSLAVNTAAPEYAGRDSGVAIVDHTFGTVYYGMLRTAAHARMRADAQLIAAAPELLAIVEELVRRWDDRGFYEVGHDLLIEKARTLLAAALGADPERKLEGRDG